jgi:hypothetical protein
MRKFHKYISISLISCVVFIAGVFAGKFYDEFDFLCSSASPHTLSADMVTEAGIVFPKGTIVPIRSCAYMQRFDWEFAIDNSVKLHAAEDVSAEEYGFSQLEVDNEI